MDEQETEKKPEKILVEKSGFIVFDDENYNPNKHGILHGNERNQNNVIRHPGNEKNYAGGMDVAEGAQTTGLIDDDPSVSVNQGFEKNKEIRNDGSWRRVGDDAFKSVSFNAKEKKKKQETEPEPTPATKTEKTPKTRKPPKKKRSLFGKKEKDEPETDMFGEPIASNKLEESEIGDAQDKEDEQKDKTIVPAEKLKSGGSPKIILGILGVILLAVLVGGGLMLFGGKNSQKPKPTADPVLAVDPTPEPSQNTVSTPVAQTQEPTPEVTATPEPTPESTPTPSVEPTPVPTPEPTPEPSPEPTPTPKHTPAPEPTATPAPTAKPEATATPEPTATPAPTPAPTPASYAVGEGPQGSGGRVYFPNGTSVPVNWWSGDGGMTISRTEGLMGVLSGNANYTPKVGDTMNLYDEYHYSYTYQCTSVYNTSVYDGVVYLSDGCPLMWANYGNMAIYSNGVVSFWNIL